MGQQQRNKSKQQQARPVKQHSTRGRATATRETIVNALPRETLQDIMQLLGMRDRQRAALVCEAFCEAATAATTFFKALEAACHYPPSRWDSLGCWLSAHGSQLTSLQIHNNRFLKAASSWIEASTFSCGNTWPKELPASFKLFAMTRLEELYLCPFKISTGRLPNTSLENLSRLKRLRQLSWNNVTTNEDGGAPGASVHGLAKALKRLPCLTALQLTGYDDKQAVKIIPAISSLTRLQVLSLTDSLACSGAASGLPLSLTCLDLSLTETYARRAGFLDAAPITRPALLTNLQSLTLRHVLLTTPQCLDGLQLTRLVLIAELQEGAFGSEVPQQQQQQQQHTGLPQFAGGYKGLLQWLGKQANLLHLDLNYCGRFFADGLGESLLQAVGGPSGGELWDVENDVFGLLNPLRPVQPDELQLYRNLVRHTSLQHLRIYGTLAAAAGGYMFGSLPIGALSCLTNLTLESPWSDERGGCYDTYLTPLDVLALGRACTGGNLQELTFKFVSDSAPAMAAFSHCSNLTSLFLGGGAVEGVDKLISLKQLTLDNTRINLLDVAAIAKHLTNLTEFCCETPNLPEELSVLRPWEMEGDRDLVSLVQIGGEDEEWDDIWSISSDEFEELCWQSGEDGKPVWPDPPPVHQRLAKRLPNEVWEQLAAKEADEAATAAAAAAAAAAAVEPAAAALLRGCSQQ